MKSEIVNSCECGCGQQPNKNKRFLCGHNLKLLIPHNKGKEGPRGDSHACWNGGRTTTTTGYVCILNRNHPRASSNGYVREHILIAEKALGKPLPVNAVVHHHTPEQLVICENQAYHLLLHQRTKALKACGHADWIKCGYCKQYDDPTKLVGRYHRSCHIKYMAKYNKKRATKED